MKKLIYEKKHRLHPQVYKGSVTVSIVFCILRRAKIFTDLNIYYKFEKVFLTELKKYQCDSIIHLFMSDHCHFIIQGKNENSDVLKALKIFKQKTGFWFSEHKNIAKWQKDFYDHIIRNDEDIKNQVYYILYNPVRAGIVENWKDYKLKGSTVYNLDEFE